MSSSENSETTLGRLAARGTFWSVLSFGSAQFIRLGSNLVLTRLLFEEAFGLMALVTVFLVALQLFSDIGIGPSIVQNERGDEPAFYNTAWTIQVGRGVMLWLVSLLGAAPFAYFYEEPALRSLIPFCAITALLGGLNSTKLHSIERHLDLKKRFIIDVTAALLGAVVMIALAYQWRSVWALAVGVVVSSATTLVLGHVTIEGARNRLWFDRDAMSSLIRFGRWVFLSTLLTFMVSHSDRLIFGKLIPISMLGVYGIGANMASLPQAGLSRLSLQILFPVWSRVRNEGGDMNASVRSMRWMALLAGGWICAGFAGGGQVIIDILYDDRYRDAGWVLQLLSIGSWFMTLETTSGGVFLARGESHWLTTFGATKLVGLAVFIPLGYHLYGFPGAVAGYVASDVLRYCMTAFAMARVGTRTFLTDIALTLLFVGSAGLSYFVATKVELPWAPLVGDAFVVFVVVTLLWAPLALITWRRRRSS